MTGAMVREPLARAVPVTMPIDAAYSMGDVPYGDYGRRNTLTMGRLLAILWRRKLLFASSFALLFGVSLGLIMNLRPRYTSEALLMIDPRQTHITNIQSVQEAPSSISDLNFVRSEMQILDSDELALHVVEKLQLEDNAEFAAPAVADPGLMARVLKRLGLYEAPPAPMSPDARRAAAVASYKAHFSSFNDTRSFIISVSFSASDPLLAQRVLAAHLQTYLDDQRASKQLVINKAEIWFETELGQLQDQLLAAEAKQQQFRSENGLLQAGGETLAGRQLTAVTAQLLQARVDLARKNDRYQSLKAQAAGAVASRAADEGDADTALLSSEALQRLRSQQSEASQAIARLQTQYGPNYPGVAAARATLADVAATIGAERRRLVASAQRDAAIAQMDVLDLEDAQHKLEQQLGTISAAELTANQIARETDADRRLYDDLLARSKQVAVQRETQEPDAMLVSNASLALHPTFPRVGVLGAIAAMGAALVATTLAVARELLQKRSFKSLQDIEADAGLPGLAAVPRIRLRRGQKTPDLGGPSQLANSFQTLRNSVFFRCRSDGANVVVFTSAMMHDGKSLTSVLFAQSVALNGKRVLLVDGDLRRGGITRMLRLSAGLSNGAGLGDVLRRRVSLGDAVRHNEDTGCDVLACDVRTAEPQSVLVADRITDLLNQARMLYDVVVIDTPAMAAVDDALSFAGLADATVLVVRWSSTGVTVVQGALRRLRLAGATVVGAVLNAVDPAGYQARDLEAYRLLAHQAADAG